MRVLHLHSGNLYGGIETLLLTLARSAEAAPEMESEFGLCFDGRLAGELTGSGAKVHQLGGVRVSRPWTVWRARRRLSRLLRRHAFSVVVCHSTWAQGLFGRVVRSHGLPLVFWQHGIADGRHWLERWARRIAPDLAISNSRFTRASLRNLYPAVPAEVVYCPVIGSAAELPAGGREAARAELSTPANAVVIVHAGRLESWKGHSLLLDALGQLRDDPRWVCWQLGGPQRPEEAAFLRELRAQAEAVGIGDRIRFAGQRSDVRELLLAADIHCQPNLGPEPFGIGFVEAMASGIPVVTTAMGGALELVDSTCGVLVPPEPEPLAAALRSLIEDEDARRALGANGRARAQALTDPEVILPRVGALLASAQEPND